MARDWESWLKNATGPASATEQQDAERTERRIREAIDAHPQLSGNVRVFLKGSYKNNTNVRRDSDVDIAVEWKTWQYVTKSNEAAPLTWEQLSVTTTDLGPTPAEYRGWVEQALTNAFGYAAVSAGNKAITVSRNNTTLDADVVPCFRLLRYDKRGGTPHQGIRLYPRTGSSVENWPQQHCDNGVAKNNHTSRRYKQIIRAIKRLENEMVATGRLAKPVHGYFVECLLYNLPDTTFTLDSYLDTTKFVLASIWDEIDKGRHDDWVEVNGLKWLWRSGQTWTAEEASAFALTAWHYLKDA